MLERAASLFRAGRLEEAREIGERLLEADPRDFHALHLLGAIAVRTRDAEAAIDFATRALALRPDDREALCNRAIALRSLDRIDEALADYDRVLARHPDFAPALNLKGVALAALNRHREAIALYTRALALKPGFATAQLNRAFSHLALGELEQGWTDFEARWTGSDTQIPRRPFPRPQWQGEDLEGKTILVHAEQGLGDTLQFARYARLLQARGARVVLEVQVVLKGLLESVPGISQVMGMGESLPPFDVHCPIVSVPRVFRTRLETIPADVPYVKAPASYVDKWRARLGDAPRPRIGIAWSGNTRQRNDRNRSMPLAALDPIRVPGRTLVSLQKEIRVEDRELLDRPHPVLHFEDDLVDFRDTAALLELMDLVVSVDTSVAHLAGALGKPLHLLLAFAADWRWLLERRDSPWYPTATLFRQERRGDWTAVVEAVARALESGTLVMRR